MGDLVGQRNRARIEREDAVGPAGIAFRKAEDPAVHQDGAQAGPGVGGQFLQPADHRAPPLMKSTMAPSAAASASRRQLVLRAPRLLPDLHEARVLEQLEVAGGGGRIHAQELRHLQVGAGLLRQVPEHPQPGPVPHGQGREQQAVRGFLGGGRQAAGRRRTGRSSRSARRSAAGVATREGVRTMRSTSASRTRISGLVRKTYSPDRARKTRSESPRT